MNSAATETSEEIRNSAECTAFRAITVKSPARIAAIENIQKKTDSQPDKIIADFQLPIADLNRLSIFRFAFHQKTRRSATVRIFLSTRSLHPVAAEPVFASGVRPR